MRNFHEVLREKKSAVERVRREVEALRLVIPLLSEEGDSRWNTAARALAENGEDRVASHQAYPAKIPPRVADAAATDAKFARAKKLSRQLRRIAAPLLGTSGN